MSPELVVVLAAERDQSFDEIESRLREALRAQFGLDEQGCARFCLYDAFPEYLIARGPSDGTYRIPYTIAGDAVTFGDAQEVETAYVPVSAECEFVAGEAAGTEDGSFPIVIIKPGWAGGALNGQTVPHYYTPELCAQVAEAAQGVPFGRKHPDQKGPDPTGALDPDRVAGYVSEGKFDGGVAKGKVTVFAAESDLRSKLNEARASGNLGLFGVSMLAAVSGTAGKVEGKDAFVISKLTKLYSVDLCQRAGAGGQFLAAAGAFGGTFATAQQAAVKSNSTAIAPQRATGPNPGGTQRADQSGARMNPHLKALLDALMKKNPTKAAEYYSRGVLATEAEQQTLQAEVLVALSEAPAPATVLSAESLAQARTQIAELRRGRIAGKLVESKLPEPAKKLVREHLETAVVAESELTDASIDAEITRTRDAFASFENVGRVRQGSVVLDSRDKLALAMEGMLGVKEAAGKGVPKFRGIREAYTKITGDTDLAALASGRGFTGSVLVTEAVSTGDFPNLLLDAMHKRLAQDYAENDLGGLEALYETVSLDDFKLRNVVRDGYFGELPTVAEAGPYLELNKPGDERIDYTPVKKGGLLTISEETIRNDDLGAISRWPGKLARGGRNTLRSFIVNFFAANPAYQADGLALFHASHNNLLASPFGLDGLRSAQLALRRQQERDSLEYLGLPLKWIAVPPELEAAAIQLNQTNTAGSSDFYQRFGANNERIFVVEKFTDANDWYYGTDSSLAPFLEIGFLDGKRQPEIFLANQPTVGTQFTSDQLQYKVKFVYGGAVTDFHGVGKSVNA